MASEPVKFLIVDDDEVSVMKIQRVIAKARLQNPIFVAQDGLEALGILRGESGDSELTPPFIVTLDINMPRMDGHEFLCELRGDPKLSNVVVFVLTTSDSEKDVQTAYQRNIAGYLLKDAVEKDFQEKIMMIERFSNLVLLPS